MTTLIKGQKLKLADLTTDTIIFIRVQLSGNFVLDVAAFGLDAAQQLSDDRYMTFYNQPTTPCQALTLLEYDKTTSLFKLNIKQLARTIEKLVFCVSIDGLGSMAELKQSRVQILNQAQQLLAEFCFDGSLFQSERALMLAEVYKKDDVWRFAAIAQGFNGGLSALVTHFGGEVEEQAPPITVQPTITAKPPAETSQTTQKEAPKSGPNLSKVTLDKPGAQHAINLSKASDHKLIVEAIWVDNGDNNDGNDDLDLRVGLLVFNQKTMQYIHAPDAAGNLNAAPYVKHMGDMRNASAKEPGVERVEVNRDIAKLLGAKVALVFSVYSAVSNGAVSIASLQPKMCMQYGDQIVECVFNKTTSAKAKSRFVYTYVIGIAIIDTDKITLEHSGLTSDRFSEDTPRITWKGDKAVVTVDGPSIFKNN